jgi:outer membrane biosynthesis protein TonB
MDTKSTKGFVPEELDLDSIPSAPVAEVPKASNVAKTKAAAPAPKAEPKVEPKPKPKAEAKPTVKAKVKADPKPTVKAKVKAEVKPTVKAKVKAEVKPKAKKASGNGKAKSAAPRGEGIVAFMLSELRARPITANDLAAKAHKRFPDHKIEKLYNTVRGALKIAKKTSGMKVIRDSGDRTYHFISK